MNVIHRRGKRHFNQAPNGRQRKTGDGQKKARRQGRKTPYQSEKSGARAPSVDITGEARSV